MKRLTKKAFGGAEMNTLSQLMNNLSLDMSAFNQSNIMPNTFDSPSYSSINLKPTGFDTSLNNKSKNKRQFGFNPTNYAYLQAANSLLSGVGNIYQDSMNQQSLIQNRLNPLPQVGSLSPEQKYGSGYGASFKDGGTYYDSYYGKYFEKRKDEEKKIEPNNVNNSPRITSSDIEENPSIVDDLLDLFSFNKKESLYRPTKAMNYSSNVSMNRNILDGSWASKFKMVEDPQGKFNHGNGAFGTFGYRKSGHLQEAFKKSPEFEDMRKNYSNFESFWDNFTNQGYGNLSKEVDTRYESWLKRQSNNDLSTAGRFNLTGSKSNKVEDNGSNNMSTSSYINKLFKFKEGGLSKFMSKAGLGKQSKYIQNSKQESGGIFYVDTTTLANLRTANKKFKYV